MYAELSYFDRFAFSHIAAWEERQRLERKRIYAIKMLDRRNVRR